MASCSRSASRVRLARPVSGSCRAISARRSSLSFCSVTSCMATTAPSIQPVVVHQGLAVDADLALVPVLRLEDDLDVAELLAGHGPDQRVLTLGHGRPVGPAQALVGGDGPDRVVVLVEPVELAGGRVEHGDAPLVVAGHDALFQRVQQHLEELLLPPQLRPPTWRTAVTSLNEATAPVTAPSAPAWPGRWLRTHIGGRPVAQEAVDDPDRPAALRRLAPMGSSAAVDRLSVDIDHLDAPGPGRSHQVVDPPADEPHPGSLEHHLERLVDPDHRAVGVDHHHPVGQRLDDGGLPAVDVEDLLLEALVLGDVPDVDHDPADGIVEMVGRHHLEVDRLPVGPHRAHLEGHRQPASGHQVVEEGPHRLDAQRVEQPEGVEPDDVADVVAEQALGRCADEDEAAGGADHRHHVEVLLAEGVEPRLARRPRPVAGRRDRAPDATGTVAGTGPTGSGPPTARGPRTRRRR